MSESLEIGIVEGDIVEVDGWGDQVDDLLAGITGRHHRKKRHTLLKLAEATYLNQSQASVFKLQSCASKVAHYKWRQVDPAYEEAYLFMIGDEDRPGLARVAREEELDALERQAVSAISQARTELRIATADAATALRDALSARDRFGPDWSIRVKAATAILDRADDETAQRSAVNVTTVEDAIAKVYGQAGALASQRAALTAGSGSDDSTAAGADEHMREGLASKQAYQSTGQVDETASHDEDELTRLQATSQLPLIQDEQQPAGDENDLLATLHTELTRAQDSDETADDEADNEGEATK
jgi:hypothetical protein